MNYNTISAQRIAGALGAEVAGVDLSRPLSDEVIGEIRQALLDHQVIFFHDQHLIPEQHLAFGRRFGELQIHDFVEPAEEDQRILEVRKEPYETRNFGGRLAHRCQLSRTAVARLGALRARNSSRRW
jgi:taurine dioxygenase